MSNFYSWECHTTNVTGSVLSDTCILLLVRPEKTILLFPEMWVTKKVFTRAAAKEFSLSTQFNFFKKVYTQKTALTALFFV